MLKQRNNIVQKTVFYPRKYILQQTRQLYLQTFRGITFPFFLIPSRIYKYWWIFIKFRCNFCLCMYRVTHKVCDSREDCTVFIQSIHDSLQLWNGVRRLNLTLELSFKSSWQSHPSWVTLNVFTFTFKCLFIIQIIYKYKNGILK